MYITQNLLQIQLAIIKSSNMTANIYATQKGQVNKNSVTISKKC